MATQEEAAAKPPVPLKYKTWVLKVSVHCEGCKRKVKKILHAIEGVYVVDVDIKLHKATVTGNVDSATLIRKLEKSGKHAELWPVKTEHKEGKKNKKKKDKQDDQKDPDANNDDGSTPAEKEKPESAEDGASESPSKAVEGASPVKNGGGAQKKEAKPKAEQKKPPVEISQSPESGPATADSAPGGNGGGGGKKTKNKGNKGNNGDGNGNNDQGQPTGGDDNGAGEGSVEAARAKPGPDGRGGAKGKAPDHGSGPGCFPMCDRPAAYYGPPPVYAVSYNTAYPASSYTASYYASPPPYSYAYVHQGPPPPPPVWGPPPSEWSGYGAARPSDSYEMFSDENPNACRVM